jgi:hypothetical protein
MYEIRAEYNAHHITVYQAYNEAIALPAIEAQQFVPPFSLNRMTWIKPSFLWMMARSNWGQKANQEYILAVRIKREAWDNALAEAVLTNPDAHGDGADWSEAFKKSRVIVQWDPEYSIRGGKLQHRSIQVGISRQLIQAYAQDWIGQIKDMTPLVRKMQALRKEGKYTAAEKLLPNEHIYPVADEVAKRLGMNK